MSAQMPLHFHHSQAHERSLQTVRIVACLVSSGSAFAFRLLFPYGLSRISRCSVREALADDALDRPLGALNVIYAQPNAITAEIEFRQVAMQVLLGAVLVD